MQKTEPTTTEYNDNIGENTHTHPPLIVPVIEMSLWARHEISHLIAGSRRHDTIC